MKRWLLLRFVFCASWLCGPGVPLLAQTEPEAADGTLLIQSSQDTIAVPIGSTLTVNYRHDPHTYRNQRLDAVMDSALIISGDVVDIRYVDRVGVRRTELHKAGKITLLASIGAILAFWFLVACLFAFYTNPPMLFVTSLLLVLVSVPASLAMPSGLIVGTVLLAVSTKFYQLGYKWKLGTRMSGKSNTKK